MPILAVHSMGKGPELNKKGESGLNTHYSLLSNHRHNICSWPKFLLPCVVV